MTEENSENAFDKVKKGIKETAEGVKEGIEDGAEGIKEGVEEIAKESTYSYTKLYGQTEDREHNNAEGNEPMNPEDIASHEQTTVSRDHDTEITEGQAETNTEEAREKFRKK